MNTNWLKLIMKITKVEYGNNLLLKGTPILFNKGGARLSIGENVTVKSSFLSNYHLVTTDCTERRFLYDRSDVLHKYRRINNNE